MELSWVCMVVAEGVAVGIGADGVTVIGMCGDPCVEVVWEEIVVDIGEGLLDNNKLSRQSLSRTSGSRGGSLYTW